MIAFKPKHSFDRPREWKNFDLGPTYLFVLLLDTLKGTGARSTAGTGLPCAPDRVAQVRMASRPGGISCQLAISEDYNSAAN